MHICILKNIKIPKGIIMIISFVIGGCQNYSKMYFADQHIIIARYKGKNEKNLHKHVKAKHQATKYP